MAPAGLGREKREPEWALRHETWVVWRDYELFESLGWGASEEDHLPTLPPPRGLPDDATPQTVEEFEFQRGHTRSATWLDVEELVRVLDERSEVRRKAETAGLMDIVDAMLEARHEPGVLWVRAVYWFDG